MAAQKKEQPKDQAPVVTTPTRQGVADPLAAAGEMRTPAVAVEDLLRIRNLQYQKDKRLLEIQRLQAESVAFDAAINDAIWIAARNTEESCKCKVDLVTLYKFDLDVLQFVPRVSPSAPSATKPMEAKPNVPKKP